MVTSTSWAVLWRLAGVALGAVATGIVARTLDPGLFGTLVFALAVVGLIGALGDFGVSTIALRELAARPQDTARLAAGVVVYRAVATLVVAPIGAVAGLLTDPGPSRTLFYVVYLLVVPGPLLGLQTIPQSRLRVGLAAAPSLVQSVVWVGLAALAAWLGWGAVALASLFVVSVVAQVVITVVLARALGPIDWRAGPGAARGLWRQSRVVGVSTVFFLGYHRGDTVLLQGLAGSGQTVLYGGAYRVVETANLVANSLFGALIPAVARRDGDRRRAHRLALELAGLAGFGGGLVLLLVAGPLTSLLYGAAYDSMVPVVQVGSVVAGAFVFEIALNQLLVTEHVLRAPAVLSPVSFGVQFLGVCVVAVSYGALGAMAVTATVQTLRVVALAVIAARHRIVLPLRRWLCSALVTAMATTAALGGAAVGVVATLVATGLAVALASGTELRSTLGGTLRRRPDH
jgi:O-antigen/teichoic acid export membrane protein